MSDIAIQIRELGKAYKLNRKRGKQSRTLQEDLLQFGKRLLSWGKTSSKEESFWALENVTFDVRKGEVFGLVGPNGAGKSTLLKILSRITEPTAGFAKLHGRVGSLLEVKTGFHPELTGRENIYLSGAILGMTHHEIDEKFDEIIQFSGVERFLDTPVKRYSSGMQVRLGFAVAAHLDPEILLIDEVLAVGDAEFRKKCLGKMSHIANGGRTIVFVSHNLNAIENLCDRVAFIQHGNVEYLGTPGDAIRNYLEATGQTSSKSLQAKQHKGNGRIRVTSIEFENPAGTPINDIAAGSTVNILLHYEASSRLDAEQLEVEITCQTAYQVPVFILSNKLTGEKLEPLPPTGTFVCQIDRLPLPPTDYRLGFTVRSQDEICDAVEEAVDFTTVRGDFFGTNRLPTHKKGVCLVDGHWGIREGKSDTAPGQTSHSRIPRSSVD